MARCDPMRRLRARMTDSMGLGRRSRTPHTRGHMLLPGPATLVVAVLAFPSCGPSADPAAREPRSPTSSATPAARPRSDTAFARHRGMSYGYGFLPNDSGGYGSPTSARSLARLRELGVDWISITPFGFLSRPTDTYITWKGKGIVETDESLKQAADDAHALGMRVMMKPHIWVAPPAWPGSVGQSTAEDWRLWFDSYSRFILHYAGLARSIGVDALCVGTELEKTTTHTAEWAKMIASIRAVFRGPLTYASNPQEVHAVGFWERLDFIGVNGYYPLAPSRTPTVDELVAAWSIESKRLAALSQRFGKPVVFTELGYRSADFAAWKHWEIPDDAPVNLQAQANAYEAFYRAIWPEPWCGGVYLVK